MADENKGFFKGIFKKLGIAADESQPETGSDAPAANIVTSGVPAPAPALVPPQPGRSSSGSTMRPRTRPPPSHLGRLDRHQAHIRP